MLIDTLRLQTPDVMAERFDVGLMMANRIADDPLVAMDFGPKFAAAFPAYAQEREDYRGLLMELAGEDDDLPTQLLACDALTLALCDMPELRESLNIPKPDYETSQDFLRRFETLQEALKDMEFDFLKDDFEAAVMIAEDLQMRLALARALGDPSYCPPLQSMFSRIRSASVQRVGAIAGDGLSPRQREQVEAFQHSIWPQFVAFVIHAEPWGKSQTR